MKKPPLTRPLTGEEAIQVALLGTCQITLRELKARLPLEPDRRLREKREYGIKLMERAIESIDMTLDGWVNPEFENKFTKYHKMIEGDITGLLMTYKETV